MGVSPPPTPSPTAADSAQTWSYPDLLGNTLTIADGTGTQTTTTPLVYDPYGSLIAGDYPDNTGSVDLSNAWSGGATTESTLSTPIVNMGSRPYSPAIGRFLQPDPVAGGNANPYGYPADPINSSDKNGRQSISFDMGALTGLAPMGAGLGAIMGGIQTVADDLGGGITAVAGALNDLVASAAAVINLIHSLPPIGFDPWPNGLFPGVANAFNTAINAGIAAYGYLAGATSIIAGGIPQVQTYSGAIADDTRLPAPGRSFVQSTFGDVCRWSTFFLSPIGVPGVVPWLSGVGAAIVAEVAGGGPEDPASDVAAVPAFAAGVAFGQQLQPIVAAGVKTISTACYVWG